MKSTKDLMNLDFIMMINRTKLIVECSEIDKVEPCIMPDIIFYSDLSSSDASIGHVSSLRDKFRKSSVYVPIFVSLQGSKIHLIIPNGQDRHCYKGEEVSLSTLGTEINDSLLYITDSFFAYELLPGVNIKIGDQVDLTITNISSFSIDCIVIEEGLLSDGQDIYVPKNTNVSHVDFLTPEDRACLESALSLSLDYVLMPFRNKQEVSHLKALVRHTELSVLARVDDHDQYTEEIIANVDGVVIYVQDLIRKASMDRFLCTQKLICKIAHQHAKPIWIKDTSLDYVSYFMTEGIDAFFVTGQNMTKMMHHLSLEKELMQYQVKPSVQTWISHLINAHSIVSIVSDTYTEDLKLYTANCHHVPVFISARFAGNKKFVLYQRVYLIDSDDIWLAATDIMIHNMKINNEDKVLHITSNPYMSFTIRGIL